MAENFIQEEKKRARNVVNVSRKKTEKGKCQV